MRKPFYPPLIAVFLVLALFNANSHQLVSSRVVVLPLLIAIGLSIALWLVMSIALRSWQKAALTACVLIPMLLCYGHFRGIFGIDESITLTVWVMVIAVMALVTLLIRKPPTLILNITAICLTLVVLVPFSIFAISTPPIPTRTTDDTPESTNTPDIYYIVMDEYSRDDVLLDMCGFDNSEFTDYLRDKGFYVADNSYTSYPATILSLASSLNMNYLPGSDKPLQVKDLCNLIRNNEVYKQLRQRGYTIVHIHSWWNVTAFSESADVNYNHDSQSEFFYLFCDMTLCQPKVTTEERYYECIKYQFSKLREIPQISAPTFTFVHIMITHAPYLFNPDGSFRAKEDIPPTGRMYVEPYIDQVEAANGMLRETVDAILAKGDAIIVLQSDTGTHPLGLPSYLSEPNRTFNNIVLEDPYTVWAKLAILSAVYPDIGHEFTTPTNTFRTIFNHYFDTDHEILPDKQFFTTTLPPPFKIFEVTDGLKEYINK